MKTKIENYLRSLIEMDFNWNEIFDITNHKNDTEVDRLVRQFDYEWTVYPTDTEPMNSDSHIERYTNWILEAVK